MCQNLSCWQCIWIVIGFYLCDKDLWCHQRCNTFCPPTENASNQLTLNSPDEPGSVWVKASLTRHLFWYVIHLRSRLLIRSKHAHKLASSASVCNRLLSVRIYYVMYICHVRSSMSNICSDVSKQDTSEAVTVKQKFWWCFFIDGNHGILWQWTSISPVVLPSHHTPSPSEFQN